MPTEKLPIFGTAFKNSDPSVLNEDSVSLISGFTGLRGETLRQPGLKTKPTYVMAQYNEPITNLYYWRGKDMIVATSGRGGVSLGTWDVSIGSYTFSPWGFISTPPLAMPAIRPMMCEDSGYVYIAGGDRLMRVLDDGNLVYMTDADLPAHSTHVGYIDRYILVNSVGTNKLFYSELNDPLTWAALDFFSAEGSPDSITAMHIKDRQIYAFGPNSFEVWQSDGTPFSRVAGSYRDIGVSAPYSIIQHSSGMYWLDSARRVVKFGGTSIEKISSPYDAEIEAYSSVADCTGDAIEISGHSLLVWRFPGVGKTLVYNVDTEQWSEFAHWTGTTYEQWLVNCHCYSDTRGQHIVGSTKDQRFYHLSHLYDSDDGTPIRLARLTGHIDNGTSRPKLVNTMRIRARSGNSQSAKMMIRWRDNGSSEWSNEEWVDLGSDGSTGFHKTLHRLGIYESRQYEFVVTDPVKAVFADAEIDFKVLR